MAMAIIKRTKKFAFTFLMLILFVNLVNAVPLVDIGVKSIFYNGDMIDFSYSFISQQNESIKYVASVNCEGAPEALLERQEINLKENELFVGKYVYDIVNEDMKSGNCLASIFILEPYEVEFTESFEINTLFDFDFTLLFCKDPSCIEKSKVFVIGEEIYLDYSSATENIEIETILVFPRGKPENIILPTSIKAEQIGTHELQITVSKEGYKTISLNEQFGVIEGEVDISYTDVDKIGSLVKNNLIYYLIGGCVVLVLLLGLLLVIKKKRKKIDSKYVKP